MRDDNHAPDCSVIGAVLLPSLPDSPEAFWGWEGSLIPTRLPILIFPK